MDEQWIDAQQAAEILGVEKGTVYVYSQRGKLTPRRTPRGARWRVRYLLAEVEQLRQSFQRHGVIHDR